MGQAKQRKASRNLVEKQALEHLRTMGAGWSPVAEAWLQEHFVQTLSSAALQGADCWQNRLYLSALKHEDAAVRAGIRLVMNNVFTAGLQPGRVVFGLVAELKLPRREVVGEFDHCRPLEAWVARQLGLPTENVYMRHSCLFAPAHAGLFCVTTTLYPLATPKPVGDKPTARTRAMEDDVYRRQAVLFLVSVETDGQLDLGRLTQDPFECELPYWGPEDVSPSSMAVVRPIEPVMAFEGVELISFRAPLAAAAVTVGPWRDLNATQTLEVRLVEAERGRRFLQETAVLGRIGNTTMPEVALYQGPDAEFFVPHLDRLSMKVLVRK